MKSRVVLAPPYSGVLFWVISCHAANHPIRSEFNEQHPYFNKYGGYYRNVFGANPAGLLDETLSLTLLYDEIFLPPTDISWGARGRVIGVACYTSPELGITMDWRWRYEISTKLGQDETTNLLLGSPQIASLVNSLPDKWEVVWNSVVILYMSEKLDAPIIASRSTIKLLRLIKSVLSDRVSNTVEKAPYKQLRFLTEAFKIAGLRLSIEDLKEYMALKRNGTIQEYGSSFRDVIDNLPNNETMEARYYRVMMDMIETHEFANKLSADLSIAGTALGISSLIPIVGTVTGAVGLSADLGSRGAEKIASKHSYWSLAPAISKVLTKHRIEQRLRRLEQSKG